MSETDELFGVPTEGEGELDLEALFQECAESPADPPPFCGEPQSAEEAEAPAVKETEPTAKTTPAAEANPRTKTEPEGKTDPAAKAAQETAAVTEKAAVTESAAETKKEEEPEPDLFAAFAQEGEKPAPKAADAKTEAAPREEQQVSLFDKPAIFKYGSAREPIHDASMTFEELRIQKAEDFPELEEGKKVSWSVKYGSITKTVDKPQETTIAKMKEEIEKSKPFLDALTKGKLKDPECLVTPQVRAGSKGIAAYRGVYPTVEAARASDKVICIIPASNGRIYELRKEEMGEFIVPKNKVTEFNEVRAGFTPALPLIPRELMGQLISFFRSFMNREGEFEALAFIYWDKLKKRFFAYIPRQTAGKAFIGYQVEKDTFPEERYIHYADIHSHNSMAAEFSSVDDADEKATRLYLVVGRLDRFYPDITARVSCGGTFLEIEPADVIDGIGEEFPVEWLDQVKRDAPYSEGRKGSKGNPLVSKCLKVVLG